MCLSHLPALEVGLAALLQMPNRSKRGREREELLVLSRGIYRDEKNNEGGIFSRACSQKTPRAEKACVNKVRASSYIRREAPSQSEMCVQQQQRRRSFVR